MTGRLKRRSSVGFGGGRRDSFQPEPAVFTQDPDREEEERKARNRQRKQQQEQHSVDSPGGPGAGGSHSGRRSIGGISGLTAAQLAEHYNNCIKLSSENKISTKNAFNLQLIDYMATMMKKKESDMNNFQVAAGTLDASTKIYAFRVDAVYGDTLKIASGLGQTAKQNDDANPAEGAIGEGAENVDENDPEKKTKKRFKKSATIEKNLKNISVTKFELEFEVDPLFKKTSSQFDGSAGGNQFLATLNVRDETCELLLDSGTTLESIHDERDVPSDLELMDIDLPSIENSLICPTFNGFMFNGWSVDKEEADEAYDKLNESINLNNSQNKGNSLDCGDDNAFDQFAEPEPIDNIGDDIGMADHDDDIMEADWAQQSQWSEKAAGLAAGPARPGFTADMPLTPADMLSILTTAPLEYSYFDHGKMGAWAGPKHWKFKPLARPAIVDAEKVKGRKKKVIERLDYLQIDAEEDLEARVDEMLNTPKKSVKLIDKTMKGWSRERSTLPEDLHYSGHELVRLKVCNGMVVARAVSKEGNLQVDEAVPDYDYDNAADNEDYCPDIDDEDDAYGGDAPVIDDVTAGLGDSDLPPELEDFAGGNLVEAPKIVDKAALQIGYAKTAKKVDMKRIKLTTWSILTHASRKEDNVDASPEKLRDSDSEGKVDKVSDMEFSELYKLLKMPSRLPPKMSEGLSVPLAFIALLHLCNERSLELTPKPAMDDFGIKQG